MARMPVLFPDGRKLVPKPVCGTHLAGNGRYTRAVAPVVRRPAPGQRRLPIATKWPFPACEAHVTGQRKLASHSCRLDRGSRQWTNRCAAGNWAACREALCNPLVRRRGLWILQRREEIVVRQEEAFDGAIEDDDLHMLIGFERHDDLVKLWDRLGSENIER